MHSTFIIRINCCKFHQKCIEPRNLYMPNVQSTFFVHIWDSFLCVICVISENIFAIIWISLPWNQETLVGYIGEIWFDVIVSESYFITNGAILLLFMSICLHHQAFYRMFEKSVQELDHFDSKRNDEELLCNLIRFHVRSKE